MKKKKIKKNIILFTQGKEERPKGKTQYKKRREIQNRFQTMQQISYRKAHRTQCANYVERTSPRKPI